MSKKTRVRILLGCGGFFVGVGIAWICAAFGLWEASFDLSLFGVGIAVFALGLQFWSKANTLA